MAKSSRIKILGKLPNRAIIACSGGVDSMAVASYFQNGRRNFELAYFNHGTEHGNVAQEFVELYAEKIGCKVHVGNISRPKKKSESPEEYWRNERYNFFNQFNLPIVMAHQLDDVIETWIFTSLHGNPRTIPYRRGNVIRPFLLTPRTTFQNWCDVKSVPYLMDPSNSNLKYIRNRIRHKIKPEALKVNPGLHKVVAKRISEHFKEDMTCRKN